MMRIFRTKLTKKYFLFTFVVLLLSLFVVWVLVDYFSKTALRREIENRDYLLNKALSLQFKQIFLDIENDLMMYESSFERGNDAFFTKRMENLVATKPWYLFIQFFNEKGEIVERVPRIKFDEAELKLDSIIERIKWSRAPFVTDIMTLPDGRKTIGVATPLSRTSDVFEGGFIAFLNLEVLSDFLYQSRLGEKGFCFLLDGKGNIIAHTNKTLIGSDVEETNLSDALRRGKHGIWLGELNDRKVIASYYPLSYGNLGLVIGEPVTQAFIPTARLSRLLIQCFVVIIFIAIAMVYSGTNRVVQPIIKLTEQAKSYSKGEAVNFERMDTEDELTVLSNTMHQMASKLIRKEKSLFQILESIPYAVITTDKKGIIRSFNRGAEDLLLYSRKEVIGRSLFDLNLKKPGEELLFRQTLEKGEIVDEAETYVLDKKGQHHDVRLYCAPLFLQESYNSGAIVVIRDVAELKKLQQHLYRSERLAALGQLTAGIAHEIKNPLNIVSAAAEALQRRQKKNESKDAYTEELVDNILEAAARMNKLLQDFLQLSKGDPGELQPLDLIPILDELISALQSNFKARNITVYRNYRAGKAVINGNKNRITQAFLNIIINSMQAMENGGELTIAVEEQKRNWCVYIKDTGKGIKKSNLQRIFNPFFSTKLTGTGLGLAIVHEIINQHNGSIAVESEINKGTTMICMFPKLEAGGDKLEEDNSHGR